MIIYVKTPEANLPHSRFPCSALAGSRRKHIPHRPSTRKTLSTPPDFQELISRENISHSLSRLRQ